jgi:hypothetical protein
MTEFPKPPSPRGAQGSPSTGGAPSSLICAASGHNPAATSSDPEPDEFPEATPSSPRSYELRVVGGYQPGEGSSVPQSEK